MKQHKTNFNAYLIGIIAVVSIISFGMYTGTSDNQITGAVSKDSLKDEILEKIISDVESGQGVTIQDSDIEKTDNGYRITKVFKDQKALGVIDYYGKGNYDGIIVYSDGRAERTKYKIGNKVGKKEIIDKYTHEDDLQLMVDNGAMTDEKRRELLGLPPLDDSYPTTPVQDNQQQDALQQFNQKAAEIPLGQKLENALTGYSGFGALSQFFFEEEDLDEWRESVDEVFATYYLGSEYWISEICSQYTDQQAEGIAYFDTEIGLSGIAAHIEATRSAPILLPTDIDVGLDLPSQGANEYGIINAPGAYLYKITFNVRNGETENDKKALKTMRFNVLLRGDREIYLYASDVEVKKGEQFGATGSSAIVQYSNNFYNEICLEFERVPSKWRLNGNLLCNVISDVSATATYLGDDDEEQSGSQSDPEKGIIIPI